MLSVRDIPPLTYEHIMCHQPQGKCVYVPRYQWRSQDFGLGGANVSTDLYDLVI